MQIKFKKKYIILSVIILLIFTALFYFLYKEIQVKNKNSEKILTEWQIEDARRNEIKTILKSIVIIEEDNQLIETRFAKSSNLVPFLDTIDSFASKVAGENEFISVEIVPETKELILGLRVLGSFESVYKFITLLENSQYEIEFIKVDVKKAVGQNSKGTTGITSEKTGKIYEWEGFLTIKLLTFLP
ncbi:MAG: hypothetical protein ABH951_02140 [Patescibacteria group bacterium]